jgi:hypothetical protein
MTAARLKRLEALERRRPAIFRPFDHAAAAELLLWFIACANAVEAGRACAIPFFGPHPEPTPAKAAALKQLDGIGARLAQERHS